MDTALNPEDRTPRRTHIFLSLFGSRNARAHLIIRTCVWFKAQDATGVVCCLVAHPKSFHHTACFTKHFLVFVTPSHHSVPHLHRLHPLHDRLLESGVPFVLLRWNEDSLGIWLKHFLTQVMSPTPATTSAVSTRRSITARGETASTSRMTFPPQWQPPRTLTVVISKRQPAVAHNMYQLNPWLSADLRSRTRKAVRGCVSNTSVQGTLSRGTRDRDLEREQTLSEKQNLHVYLEQKLDWLFEVNVQLRKYNLRLKCEQNTHSNSMYKCAQCVTTHTEQKDHISSREHPCSRLHLFVSQK